MSTLQVPVNSYLEKQLDRVIDVLQKVNNAGEAFGFIDESLCASLRVILQRKGYSVITGSVRYGDEDFRLRTYIEAQCDASAAARAQGRKDWTQALSKNPDLGLGVAQAASRHTWPRATHGKPKLSACCVAMSNVLAVRGMSGAITLLNKEAEDNQEFNRSMEAFDSLLLDHRKKGADDQ